MTPEQAFLYVESVAEVLSPARFGKGRLQRLVLLNLLTKHHGVERGLPTNGRFVMYELETDGHVTKSGQGQTRRGTADHPREQEVAEALMALRVTGVIPWEWIVDETRALYDFGESATTILDAVTDVVNVARTNPWDHTPPLILVESRSLGGVLRSVAEDYRVAIAATNGQVGGFLRTAIIPALDGNDREVLYLGDRDLQGDQIETNTRRVLERELGRELAWQRLAITAEQVETRGLYPMLKSDHRYRPALPYEAWECEALGQGVVVNLVTDALDDLLGVDLAQLQDDEDGQREDVRTLLRGAAS